MSDSILGRLWSWITAPFRFVYRKIAAALEGSRIAEMRTEVAKVAEKHPNVTGAIVFGGAVGLGTITGTWWLGLAAFCGATLAVCRTMVDGMFQLGRYAADIAVGAALASGALLIAGAGALSPWSLVAVPVAIIGTYWVRNALSIAEFAHFTHTLQQEFA
jgi:hypothetical protein